MSPWSAVSTSTFFGLTLQLHFHAGKCTCHKVCSHKSQSNDRWLFKVSPSLKKQEFMLYFLFYDTCLHLGVITITIITVYGVRPYVKWRFYHPDWRVSDPCSIISCNVWVAAPPFPVFVEPVNQNSPNHWPRGTSAVTHTHTYFLSSSVAHKEGTNSLRGVRTFWFIYMWEGLLRCRLHC